MKFFVFVFILTAFAIAAPVANSSSKQFRLSMQQAEHLKVNEDKIANHDTVLYIVIHDTDLEMARLCFAMTTSISISNRWLKGFFVSITKGRNFPIDNCIMMGGRRMWVM
jgi:hypothetical protein